MIWQRPYPRRRAKVWQTIESAAQAVVFPVSKTSMIAAFGSDLAAKYPIGPRGVGKNKRYQHGDTEQHEDLAGRGRSRLPNGDALRHDIGIHADAEPGIGEREQGERQKERPVILPVD